MTKSPNAKSKISSSPVSVSLWMRFWGRLGVLRLRFGRRFEQLLNECPRNRCTQLHTITFLLHLQTIQSRFHVGIGMVRARLALGRLEYGKEMLKLLGPVLGRSIVFKKIFHSQQHVP